MWNSSSSDNSILDISCDEVCVVCFRVFRLTSKFLGYAEKYAKEGIDWQGVRNRSEVAALGSEASGPQAATINDQQDETKPLHPCSKVRRSTTALTYAGYLALLPDSCSGVVRRNTKNTKVSGRDIFFGW